LQIEKAKIGQQIPAWHSIGLILKLAVSRLRHGMKQQAKASKSSALTDKRWLVSILPAVEDLRPGMTMCIGPLSDAVVKNARKFISRCCANQKLEYFEYQISNHQKGLLWCIGQGKIIDLAPSAVINNDAAGHSPQDWIAGPLWLTGSKSKEGIVELLTEEDALEVMNVIRDNDVIQVMDGLYLSTRNIDSAEYETGSI
jgi:hypothetical protein